MSIPALPRRRSSLDVRHDGDHAVVVDRHGREVGDLNATALALWELCDGATSPEEMVDAVCSLWAIPHDVAERDVTATLEQLVEVGLVK
jgi:hypothetical protein